MQVMKFGGTSVSNADNMNKVVQIVIDALSEDKTIVVASALSGVTDALIKIGKTAEVGDSMYEQMLADIEARHYNLIEELLPVDFRENFKTEIQALFKEVKGICKGVSRIRELSFHTLDLIMSFGELCSTKILTAKFISMGFGCKWVDARQIVCTYHDLSQNIVDLEKTNENAINAFTGSRVHLFIVP